MYIYLFKLYSAILVYFSTCLPYYFEWRSNSLQNSTGQL